MARLVLTIFIGDIEHPFAIWRYWTRIPNVFQTSDDWFRTIRIQRLFVEAPGAVTVRSEDDGIRIVRPSSYPIGCFVQ
jgi:hypothetical protein